MLFIDSEGNYPLFMGDIRRITSTEWNIGDELPEGFEQVHSAPYPEINEDTHTLEEISPVRNEDGLYVQTYQIRELTEQELEIRNAPTSVREKLSELGFSEAEISLIIR